VEFNEIPDALYLGFRRGGDEDKIRRPQNLVPSHTAAQALVAFHQEPNRAYNEKASIWESDSIYGGYFNDKLSAAHLLFCFSLLRALEQIKRELSQTKEDERTESQRAQVEFFRQRGSTFLLAAAIARCLETYLGSPIADSYSVKCSAGTSPAKAIDAWKPLASAALPFVKNLAPAASGGVKNSQVIRENIDTFKSLVEATAGANEKTFRAFRRNVRGNPKGRRVAKAC